MNWQSITTDEVARRLVGGVFVVTGVDINGDILRAILLEDAKENPLRIEAGPYGSNLKVFQPATRQRWIVAGRFLGLVDVREEFSALGDAERRLGEYREKCREGGTLPTGKEIGLEVHQAVVA